MSRPAVPAPVTAAEGRTALVVVVDEATPLVASFRRRHHPRAVERNIPPHVTILVPFVPAAALDLEVMAAAEDLLGSLPAFDASLEHVASFPAYVWLAPAPRERFLGLIRHVYARFPEYPPYVGEHAEPEPHLTVGEVDTGMDIERLVGAAERELAPGLPLRFRVGRVTLLCEAADGTWSGLRTFDLG